MEGGLRPAEKWFGLHGPRETCLAQSLQTNLRTSCATAGLAMQTASEKPGLQMQLELEGGLMTTKNPKKLHGWAVVLNGLIPFSSLPRPSGHLHRKSLAVVHDQAKQKGRQRESAHHHLEPSALAEPSLVAVSRSLPFSGKYSARWQEHDYPQTHQQPALLQEWSDLPKMKACVRTSAVSLHGNTNTVQPLKSRGLSELA